MRHATRTGALISRDPTRVPSWLIINKNDLVPDFIVNDPKVK
jgi:hypothetical protein